MPFPNQHQSKRSQPVDVDNSSAPTKPSSTRKGASSSKNTPSTKNAKLSPSPSSLSPGSAGSSHGGMTPLTPATHGGYLDLHKSSKKLAKAIRGGGGHGHGGSGGGGKQFKVKQRKIGDGPEAELSEDEDEGGSDPEDYQDNAHDDDDGDTSNKVESSNRDTGAGPIERSTGTSAKEIDMVALLAGAKLRPESANISRGYEMITSPASKMIIPIVDHTRPILAHEDDEEWENVQFDMDMDDVYEHVLSASKTMSVHVHAEKPKHAYADIVKRV